MITDQTFTAGTTPAWQAFPRGRTPYRHVRKRAGLSKTPVYRLRVGRYRVILTIEDERLLIPVLETTAREDTALRDVNTASVSAARCDGRDVRSMSTKGANPVESRALEYPRNATTWSRRIWVQQSRKFPVLQEGIAPASTRQNS